MIGGNIQAVLQQKGDSTKNAIGERICEWKDIQTLKGWLDLSNGDSKYTNNAKLQESTHIFLCDYIVMNKNFDRNPENKRLLVNGFIYDVLLIDDPMELHQQIEISLKYVGAV